MVEPDSGDARFPQLDSRHAGNLLVSAEPGSHEHGIVRAERVAMQNIKAGRATNQARCLFMLQGPRQPNNEHLHSVSLASASRAHWCGAGWDGASNKSHLAFAFGLFVQ